MHFYKYKNAFLSKLTISKTLIVNFYKNYVIIFGIIDNLENMTIVLKIRTFMRKLRWMIFGGSL